MTREKYDAYCNIDFIPRTKEKTPPSSTVSRVYFRKSLLIIQKKWLNIIG